LALKKRIVYQLLGVGRIITHVSTIFIAVFFMLMGVYYDKYPEKIPTALEFMYQNPADLWQWSVMFFVTASVYGIIGFFCIFMGWKMMHPLQTKAIDVRERRKELLQKSHELKQQVMKELESVKKKNKV
jgi:UPF0716 family protein affecting phage T7 exclusion